MSGEKKRARRIAVLVDVVLGVENAHYFFEAGNLSETGMFLHTNAAFPIGTRLRMVFGRPPDLPRVEAEGIVQWCESGRGVGVEFASLTPEAKQTLVEFINRLRDSGGL